MGKEETSKSTCNVQLNEVYAYNVTKIDKQPQIPNKF